MSTQVNQANFAQEVLQDKGTVLVDFWAPWCGPCRMLGPIIEEVAGEAQGVKVCKVNVDENQDLAATYNIEAIPALFVFKAGKVVASSLGVQSKAAILEMLKK
jgi:thioredoxin 1